MHKLNYRLNKASAMARQRNLTQLVSSRAESGTNCHFGHLSLVELIVHHDYSKT
jgi:hypothetical protein